MKRALSAFLSSLSAVLLISSPLLASGFGVFEQGARAAGRGGAFVAMADDLSAMYWNPAGLAFMDGLQVYFGSTAIIPNMDARLFGSGVDQELSSDPNFPSHVYASYRLHERVVVGVSGITPFGLDVEWDDPETFAGRFISQKTELINFALEGFVAIKITDWFGVGGGGGVMTSDLTQNRAIPLGPLGEGTVELETDTETAEIFNAGILFTWIPHVRIGGSWRSQTTIDYAGTATFLVPAAVSALFPSGPATTSLTFPWLVSAGVAFVDLGKWNFEFDLNWQGHSTVRRVAIDFANESPVVQDEEIVFNYEDVFAYRAGVEVDANEVWSFRGGAGRDISPAPPIAVTPVFPDADRTFGSLGATVRFPNSPVTVDAYYMLVFLKNREGALTEFGATEAIFRTNAHLLGLSLGLAF